MRKRFAIPTLPPRPWLSLLNDSIHDFVSGSVPSWFEENMARVHARFSRLQRVINLHDVSIHDIVFTFATFF